MQPIYIALKLDWIPVKRVYICIHPASHIHDGSWGLYGGGFLKTTMGWAVGVGRGRTPKTDTD